MKAATWLTVSLISLISFPAAASAASEASAKPDAPAASRGSAEAEDERTEAKQRYHHPSGILDDMVARRLAASPSLAGSLIAVASDDRAVRLTGAVASERLKERAGRIARRVYGVEEVDNDLRIDATRRGQPSDRTDEEKARMIARYIATVVFPGAQADQEWFAGWEVEGEDWEFDVDVDGGSVTLDGTVDRRSDLSKVLDAVRGLPGVRSVYSELAVDRSLLHFDPYGDPYRDRLWRARPTDSLPVDEGF